MGGRDLRGDQIGGVEKRRGSWSDDFQDTGLVCLCPLGAREGRFVRATSVLAIWSAKLDNFCQGWVEILQRRCAWEGTVRRRGAAQGGRVGGSF